MNTNAPAPSPCPSCGRTLPAGALAGLCPACLLAQGAETEHAETKGRSRFEPPSLDAIARLFPQLQVFGLLGAGGMGAVYKARQPALDRLVALKVLPAGGGVGSTERFNREARALARLSHPNIVGVHEFGQVEGLHFFIMEFVDGANLRQLEKTARLSPREALQIIPQICDALQYAHDEGVVHRDIKPENVLVDRKGRVKIADFGLAKIADPDPAAARLTVEGQVMGTPHYMAPEQVERPLAVDHRADIYALGVVFYEMLTGDLPLGKFAPPSRKVQVDVRLDDIVLRALENDPERRYQQANDVKSEVQTVANAPASKAAESGTDPGRPVVAAGFPLVEDRGGQRRIVWKEAFRAWAIIFGLLTLAFAFFSAVTGRSLMGWLGIVGWQSLVYRAVIGGLLVVFALKHALRPQTLPQTRHAPGQAPAFWWRSRLLRMVLFVAIAALASTWMVFQDNWLAPRLAGWFGRSEYGNIQVAKRDATSGTLSVTLANGTSVELLALAPGSAEASQWWRPDGTPLPNAAFDIQGPAEMLGNDRPRTKFAFKVTGTPWAMETATYESTPSGGISAGGTVWQNGEKIAGGWPLVAAWSQLTNKATLRFGLRFDTWRPVAAFDQGDSRRVQTWSQSGEPRWIANINHVSDNGTDTLVTAVLNSDMKDWRMRVVAIDLDGKEHPYNRGNATPTENATTWTCTFPNLTLDRIQQFQVQVQPVHWIEFRDVPLSPAGFLPRPAQEPVPVFSADAVAAEPELRFVAWQDQWQTNGVAAVRQPDGSNVTGRADLNALQHVRPTEFLVTSDDLSVAGASFLHLWFAHPAFDRESLVGVALTGEDGQPLAPGAGGRSASNVRMADPLSSGRGWLMVTLCPADGAPPATINAQLDYAVGPLGQLRAVAPDFSGMLVLEGASQLSAIGSNNRDQASVTLMVNTAGLGSRRFGASAVTRDGRALAPSAHARNFTPGSKQATETFEFDLPLSQVKEFKIGTRPVRTARWQGVVLPPRAP